VRTGTCATVGVVTVGVNMHTTLSIGIISSNVPCDGGVARLVGLLESDGSSDLGVTAEECNCMLKEWSAD